MVRAHIPAVPEAVPKLLCSGYVHQSCCDAVDEAIHMMLAEMQHEGFDQMRVGGEKGLVGEVEHDMVVLAEVLRQCLTVVASCTAAVVSSIPAPPKVGGPEVR